MFPIRDHNPSSRTPYVVYALIAANIAVFLYEAGTITTNNAQSWFYYNYAMIPARLTSGENPLALVTSMFMHAGFMHIAGNMLFLWIFGDNLEDQLGHVRFLAFYLACGVAAALTQVAADPSSPVPMVGASGAIAGVMGGYLLLFPKARVDILVIFVIIFRIFTIPAWIMLGLWFGVQVVGGFGASTDGGGVAYWAHLGGFVAGVILILPAWRRLGARNYWQTTHGHPPNPDANYEIIKSRIPQVRRRR